MAQLATMKPREILESRNELSPETVERAETFNDLWVLYYIHQNTMQSQLIRFKLGVNIGEAVEKTKTLCTRNNWRFNFVRPAILEIE